MARRGDDVRAVAGAAASPAPVVGQGAKPYRRPRMPDGHPDLQGTYDLATLDAARAAGRPEARC